mmetsp:Transcript_60711/g.140208  ORF Transcript_60711/g.140208 Transcript_60711/m.140208 type:complete len:201 (+) Transcript_60711:15-617(+)
MPPAPSASAPPPGKEAPGGRAPRAQDEVIANRWWRYCIQKEAGAKKSEEDEEIQEMRRQRYSKSSSTPQLESGEFHHDAWSRATSLPGGVATGCSIHPPAAAWYWMSRCTECEAYYGACRQASKNTTHAYLPRVHSRSSGTRSRSSDQSLPALVPPRPLVGRDLNTAISTFNRTWSYAGQGKTCGGLNGKYSFPVPHFIQ